MKFFQLQIAWNGSETLDIDKKKRSYTFVKQSQRTMDAGCHERTDGEGD